MFGLSSVQLGIMIALGVAVLGLGWALKVSVAQNGAYEAAEAINILQVEKATKQIDDLIRARDDLQTGLIAMGTENNALAQEKDAAVARYDNFRATLDNRTLANPAVIEKAARMDITSRRCGLWRKTGGEGKCPVQ